jgi:pimeloyl-ACP methyl ester carboxylesterase
MRESPEATASRFRRRQVALDGSSLHVVETGDESGTTFLFLHGWPESSRAWRDVMSLAGVRARALAIDLPGVGESVGDATDGSKAQLAEKVHELISAMDLKDVTLVGQDIGGMIVYAYLQAYEDIRRAVIMDVVLPGIAPWEEVIRNPQIWHFALHAIPSLPERLVQGRQEEYFRFFYDVLSFDPKKITPEARAAYVKAYSTDSALAAGFNWYRAFARDVEHNRDGAKREIQTPLLYMRGEHERAGDIGKYVDGLRAAGATSLEHAVIGAAGHFTQEEAPEETWRRIAEFAGVDPSSK